VTGKVVDASAVVALLFDELTRESVVSRLRGGSLHAPDLLGFEVANACVKKMRAYPGESDALRRAFSCFFELEIEFEPTDLTEAVVLARQMKLSAYDASYLWLASALGVELVTLDDKLARAHERMREVPSP
jgi:predicted nucleic acid-binding protein